MAIDRKALKQEYKEMKHPMGVYCVRNTVSGKVLVGISTNVTAMLNRHKAQLGMGGHPITALQQDWKSLGAEAFAFEVLDTIEPRDTPGYDPADDLRVLETLWLDRLTPYGDRGYNEPPKGTA